MKKFIAFIILVVLTSIAVGWVVLARQGNRQAVRAVADSNQYRALIASKTLLAEREREEAMARFKSSLRQTIASAQPQFDVAAGQAASILMEKKMMAQLLVALARDRVGTKNTTETFLVQSVGTPVIEPAVHELQFAVGAVADQLIADLQTITIRLAFELAAPAPSLPYMALRSQGTRDLQQQLRKPLGNIGVGGVVLVAAGVFDATAVGQVAARMFGKQAARVAASGALAVADGPLPIGDLVAAAGLIWTSYDIYKLGKQFGESVQASTRKNLDASAHATETRALGFAAEQVKRAQLVQKEIVTAAEADAS